MIVAIIALVAALGGTSYAALSLPKNSVGSKQLKKNAVITSKIKNGAVTAGKINTSGLTVPNALHANTAGSATNGIPRVYGFINSDGTIDTARSKNIAAVTLTGTSTYCVTPTSSSGVNVTKEFPVVVADEIQGSGIYNSAELYANKTSLCSTSAGPGWTIFTFTGGSSYTPAAFSLIAP
jgi:hypothetical protein